MCALDEEVKKVGAISDGDEADKLRAGGWVGQEEDMDRGRGEFVGVGSRIDWLEGVGFHVRLDRVCLEGLPENAAGRQTAIPGQNPGPTKSVLVYVRTNPRLLRIIVQAEHS